VQVLARSALPADVTPSPALITRLQRFMALSPAELVSLQSLARPLHKAEAHEDLITIGHAGSTAILMHQGWAICHRTLDDGRRQILDFVIPGDFCDPSVFVTPIAGFSLTTITRCIYTPVAGSALLDLIAGSPRIGAMLWWLEAQEQSLLRDHLLALGRMNAEERLARLICELWSRMQDVGLDVADGFEWPVNQEVIADATGLSVVHVNRTLHRLEHAGTIQRSGHVYHVRNPEQLRRIAHTAKATAGRTHLHADIAARLSRPS
jgi:CRP-like cAMP-binding protein